MKKFKQKPYTCKCATRSIHDCACGADWTSPQEQRYQYLVKQLKARLDSGKLTVADVIYLLQQVGAL
jgi:hypothetical protein